MRVFKKVNGQANKSSAIIIGLVIIGFGLLLLVNIANNASSVDIIMVKYWPTLILLFGAIMAASNPKAGIITILFGALLLIYQLGLFGTSTGRYVIIFLMMLLGLVLLVTSIGPKKKADSDLPPPRDK